ncbi:MAG TPA: helix-turn-helix domain-containing protein [Ilumatobacteraceae bacterium]|nr:helix-turn-helix domain-containing protein [Ilumatobacteraceae bacterium]HRB02828.1 helix-turn-helix domain-containing protein [Ilumatobacteraceae bacterium]
MTTPTLERTVLPPTESLDELVAMLSRPGAEPTTTLSGPNGEHLVLPPEIFEVLRGVVDAMASGQAVTIAPVHQRLTTQEAAELLGISRPTLVKLLESGEIPFEQPGRHRRVRLADVLTYRERSSVDRRAALDRMVEIADEADMYERTASPKRTR